MTVQMNQTLVIIYYLVILLLEDDFNACFDSNISSQRRRRKRHERKQRQMMEERQREQEEEDKRPPAQHFRDGVIHVETNHPRSSIIIIRSNEDEYTPRKPNRESSFVVPQFGEQDGTKTEDENENDVSKENCDTANVQYQERTEYVDCVGDQLIETCVNEKGDNDSKLTEKDHFQKEEALKSSRSSKRWFKKSVNVKDLSEHHSLTESLYKKSAMTKSSNSCHIKSSFHNNRAEDSSSEEEVEEPEVYESCLRQLYPEPFSAKYERYYQQRLNAYVFQLKKRPGSFYLWSAKKD